MGCNMSDITILPIFDQSAPGIWYDFGHTCARTMYSNYNNGGYFEEIDDWMHQDATDWVRCRAKFAFGAYDGATMVGFIQGWATEEYAHTQALYLLREYQGRGVGKSLLHRAEMVSTVTSKRMESKSLSGAKNFYESQGYTLRNGNDYYHKQLNGPIRADFVEVFHVYAGLAKQCQKINPRFKANMVNVHHNPMFAHFDVDGRMDGYIGAGISWPCLRDGADPDSIRDKLQNMFDWYKAFHQNQK